VLPEFSAVDAEAIARTKFGVEGTASELPSYIDRNFRIDATGGGRFVLKIANAQTDRAQMEFEGLAMNVLSAAELSLQTPRVRAGTDGELAEVTDAAGVRYVARMVNYLEGALFVDAGTPSDALLRDLGRGLAEVDRALADVQHPAMRRELPWDLAHAAWISSDLGLIRDPQRRAWVDHALLQFRGRIAPELETLPRGVIHNDANDYNLVVDGDRVCGLFDFGDMVETCRVFEVVIAATYAAFHRPEAPQDAIATVVAGYHAVSELSALELDLVHDAVRARLAVSVVSSAKAAAERRASDQDEYTSVSEEGAWALLKVLSTEGPEATRAAIRRACGLSEPQGHGRDKQALIDARKRHLGPSLSLSYGRDPLKIVRGRMQYLFDEQGQAFLDCVNNVCHVGHAHPDVVAAMAEQAAVLNTNTRYLHDALVEYIERLTATLPEHLEVAFLVCSGSEANELAIRLARTATGRHDIMILDHAYHGNTGGLVDISPYKFDGKGGAGKPSHVHVVPAPDPFRGAQGVDGAAFAEQTLGAALQHAEPAVFFAESLLGCGGQVVPPPGYLARAFELVREHGGVAVADEVQVGFGRAGSHMWAFDAQGAKPDIVTMGKPIGNGHPMAAVVTTREIADRFANGMEYFNTFGGNPVSCRVGLAVLDVIEREDLQGRAARVGEVLQAGLRRLAERFPVIADVRGMGMFIGAEFVADRDTKAPAADVLDAVVQRCRAEGILLSTDGPLHNVLKIKPPLQFDEVDATLLLGAVERGLQAVCQGQDG
jgi:4-aminobutyrate aminotransferase-like enzyme/Ser/Thr protein kinase RdoA (MazF antagonist)